MGGNSQSRNSFLFFSELSLNDKHSWNIVVVFESTMRCKANGNSHLTHFERRRSRSIDSPSFREKNSFIHSPAAYASTPLAVYEPFHGTPSDCVPIRDARMSSTDVARVVHQTFKVVPILLKNYRLWTLASPTIAQFTLRELQDAMKSYKWRICFSTFAPTPPFSRRFALRRRTCARVPPEDPPRAVFPGAVSDGAAVAACVDFADNTRQ
jgi:hypothetical protein